MDKTYSITIPAERKRGQHLDAETRGAIQRLSKLGLSNRAIAREVDCSPSTIGYELRRGTPVYSGRGRKPSYSAKRGAAVYKVNRSRCRRPRVIPRDSDFMRWMAAQVRARKWSFDACVGYARRNSLFPTVEIPCTKTLYNLLWKGELPLTLFELPEVLGRKQRGKPRVRKRLNGRSIEERPKEVDERSSFGHWESDTVLGRKKQGEPAVFTIVERMTGCYLTIRTEGKTSNSIAKAMEQLHDQFKEHFSEVFRTITTDNGSEFASLSSFEELGTVTIELPIIKKGANGVEVTALQRLLRSRGFKGKNGGALSLDGDFGSNTDYALRLFQKSAGLTVDGVCGKTTWAAILRG